MFKPASSISEEDRKRIVRNLGSTPAVFRRPWSSGEALRVVEGPFADLNGTFVDVAADETVRIDLEIAGRTARVVVLLREIEPIASAADGDALPSSQTS